MSESLTWVKSSYSSTGNCVEVAGQRGRVLLRDTKEQSRPVLSISAKAWRRFTCQVKRSLPVARSGSAATCRGCSRILSGTPKLLLAGRLNVLYLIHRLAQPGEFGVHRFPGPI